MLCEISGSHGDEYEHALMMQAVRTSETAVYFNKTTRRYIAEGCYIHEHVSSR
jgi:hypothetical protein